MRKNFYALATAGVLLFSPAFGEETSAVNGSTVPAVAVMPAKLDERSASIRSLVDQSKLAQAEREAHAWTGSAKDADQPWAFLAEISYDKKQYKKAISIAGKALNRNAGNANAYFWRGRSYEALKNWLEAANEYRAALLADPQMTQATEGLNRVKTNLSLPEMNARESGSVEHP